MKEKVFMKISHTIDELMEFISEILMSTDFNR